MKKPFLLYSYTIPEKLLLNKSCQISQNYPKPYLEVTPKYVNTFVKEINSKSENSFEICLFRLRLGGISQLLILERWLKFEKIIKKSKIGCIIDEHSIATLWVLKTNHEYSIRILFQLNFILTKFLKGKK